MKTSVPLWLYLAFYEMSARSMAEPEVLENS